MSSRVGVAGPEGFGRSSVPGGPQDSEDLADLVGLLEGVPKRELGVQAVVIAAPLSLHVQIAGLDEVGDDALDGALGDSDPVGEVAVPHPRVMRHAHQDPRVVGEESPVGHVDTIPARANMRTLMREY